MDPRIYQILHVLAGFMLVAVTFTAFAHPDPASRKRTLMLSGIWSLVMLVGGFGLQAKLGYPFAPWLIVKLVCWFVLAGIAGMAFRKPGSIGALRMLTLVAVVTALYMVYFKPALWGAAQMVGSTP